MQQEFSKQILLAKRMQLRLLIVLLKEVNNRMQKLGEPRIDHGDDHNPRPDMLTAVVTVIVAEELGIDLSRPERGSDEDDERRAAGLAH